MLRAPAKFAASRAASPASNSIAVTLPWRPTNRCNIDVLAQSRRSTRYQRCVQRWLTVVEVAFGNDGDHHDGDSGSRHDLLGVGAPDDFEFRVVIHSPAPAESSTSDDTAPYFAVL